MPAAEVLDRSVNLGGYINTESSKPLEEKNHAFTTAADDGSDSSGKNVKARNVNQEKWESTVKINDTDEEEIDCFVKDPFAPFTDTRPEGHYLTIRALFVGICAGALVNASNIYLGLKTGWTFTANIFGAIVGFAVLKAFANTPFLKNLPIIGGDFGPRENAIASTAAMASGGMSSVFVSAWPAMYQLGLLGTPETDYWRMVTLTAVGGYFGLFFATPLRKFFIIHVARELHLIFPSFSATAMTIRSMHLAGTGEALAKLKMRALSIAFAAACILRVVSQYALGILWDWHIFTWFFIWGGYDNMALAVENWGWYIEWTPAFIGVGMLVGLNVSLSFFGGSVLAWGIIGPALVHTGTAFGIQAGEGKWAPYTSFASLSPADPESGTPSSISPDSFSPRFWLLWPGVLAMIVISFAELFCQWKIFAMGGKAMGRGIGRAVRKLRHKEAKEEVRDTLDPAAPEDQVPWWQWSIPMFVIIVLTCVVMNLQFGMAVGETILAIFLAFFFSLLAIQCTGATDITPLTAASKASQLVLGGATSGQGWTVKEAQRLNLLGGALASVAAGQSSDLVSDFRVGFLLDVKPKLQWYAQAIGTLVAVFLAPGMYMLFSKAYPCINDLALADDCEFGIPSVSAWRAVAQAVTDPVFPVPKSSGIFAIIWSIFGAAMVVVRQYVWVGDRRWVRQYWPNMMVVNLAFVLPQTVYGTANVIGAVGALIWAKKAPKSYDIYGYAIAAGLIAGEGIGGVINAVFQVAGISGDVYGSAVACPGDAC